MEDPIPSEQNVAQDPSDHHDSSVFQQVIESEMKKSYLDYAMSVIVGRALPDVRDGLKPVHRRILYAMHELGLSRSKAHKKSARIVGEVLGKYHPHGDTAVYDSMVRMAQEFALRYPLVDGQGNFGSIDGDGAAAMRYTEARMTKVAEDLLLDIEKETVDFRLNFDESLKEPIVLPSKIPNLLVNGSMGIAVGMATNIAPHNITEICKGVVQLIDNPQTDTNELIQTVSGPDFPTGGIIQGRSGIVQAYAHGRGRVRLRGKTHTEEFTKRTAIIIDEIPYQVNKSSLVEEIAHAVRDKVIGGISDIRDESDREGMRIVIELKLEASAEIVLNQLFKHTRLQVTYSMINLALVNNVPRVLSLKQMLTYFIEHRVNVVTRRTQYELTKAEKRAHILLGLKKAIENLDQAISIIRGSSDPAIAKQQLAAAFALDEVQCQAILDMKLQRLTGLERDKIIAEYQELIKLIEELKDILANKHRVMAIIKTETEEMIEKYSDARKTQIVDAEDDVEIEDLIEDTDIVVTVSRGGYCKRLPVDTYKAQKRGGKGIIGASTREDDIVENVFITHNKATLLCFTSLGKVHWIKGYHIPEASRTATGKHIANMIQLDKEESVTTIVPISNFDQDKYLFFATAKGTVKKTHLSQYSRPRAGGIKGIILDDDDRLINALLTDGEEYIMLATANGNAIRFSEQDVRPMGRVTRGVRGINLVGDDKVVGLLVADAAKTILTVTEQGYGKRTNISEYRLIGRGGKGVINIQTSQRNGKVVAVRCVEDEDGLLLISKKGIIIRTRSDQISVIGRNTQGVRVMRMIPGDIVAGVSKIVNEEDVEKDVDEKINHPDQDTPKPGVPAEQKQEVMQSPQTRSTDVVQTQQAQVPSVAPVVKDKDSEDNKDDATQDNDDEQFDQKDFRPLSSKDF